MDSADYMWAPVQGDSDEYEWVLKRRVYATAPYFIATGWYLRRVEGGLQLSAPGGIDMGTFKYPFQAKNVAMLTLTLQGEDDAAVRS